MAASRKSAAGDPVPEPVLPSHPLHPDHARYRQVLDGVRQLGRWTPEEADAIAATLYAAVHAHPLLATVDEVALSDPDLEPPRVFAIHRAAAPRAPAFRASASAAAATPAGVALRPRAASPVRIDAMGYIEGAGFARRPMPVLEHGTLTGPRAIVLHRTARTAASAFAAFASGTGTHFLIDRNGSVHQTASLRQKTGHVGRIRSRCVQEGTCPPAEQAMLDAIGLAPTQVHGRETRKPYPQRYPLDEDSVGIEVVAGCSGTCSPAATSAQRASLQRLVGMLKQFYRLTDDDIHEHDVISFEALGEDTDLYGGDVDVGGRWMRDDHAPA